MEDVKKFAGKWKLYKSENFDAMLVAMGLNFVMRKMISLASPTQEITVLEDGTIEIKLSMGPMSQQNKFKIEEEFEYQQQGIKVKATARMEGDRLVVDSTPAAESRVKPQTMYREITPDGDLLQTIHCDGVVAKRFFRRVEG